MPLGARHPLSLAVRLTTADKQNALETRTHKRIQPAAGALLGNFDFSRGVEMACRHDGDDLIWEALVPLPWQPEYRYR